MDAHPSGGLNLGYLPLDTQTVFWLTMPKWGHLELSTKKRRWPIYTTYQNRQHVSYPAQKNKNCLHFQDFAVMSSWLWYPWIGLTGTLTEPPSLWEHEHVQQLWNKHKMQQLSLWERKHAIQKKTTTHLQNVDHCRKWCKLANLSLDLPPQTD